MSHQETTPSPDLKDVDPRSDADETPTREDDGARSDVKGLSDDAAAAMPNGRKPGPKESPVQVRNSGEDSDSAAPKKWDEVDEAVDESFPASDASAKY